MPGGGSVLELVSRLRGEDGELQPLLSTIDELAQRVQYCSFYNGPVEVGPPRRRGNAATDNTATGMGSMYSSKGPSQLQHGSGPEEAAGGEAGEGGSGEPSTSSPTGGGTGGGGVGGGGGRLGPGRSRTQRVEDAELPDVPDDRGLHDKDEPSALPGPQLCSEWDALTGAVAVACASFSSTNAKVTFKKWALTPANASLLVSLFWWLVADVFVSEAPMAGPLKDYVFHVFARHYTGVVLPYRSINKDAYVELWARSMATAVVTLLREAFPRSSHRFDESIEAYVHAQLVRWTAGALPADMHPSMYSAPGDRAPAASRLAGKPATTTGTTTATPASARRAATNTAAATATSARRAPPPAAGPSGRDDGWTVPPPPPPIDGETGPSGRGGPDPGPPLSLSLPPSFHTAAPGPAMSYMLASHGLEGEGGGLAGPRGRKERVGGHSTASLRRPLDCEPGDETSYRALAKQCTNAAEAAVATYEASKAVSKKEVAAVKKDLREHRALLDARANGASSLMDRANELSSRIAHYIENDLEKLMRKVSPAPHSFPVPAPAAAALKRLSEQSDAPRASGRLSPIPGSGESRHSLPHRSGSLPAHLAGTATRSGALDASGNASLLMKTAPGGGGGGGARVMGGWSSKMRSVEAGISSALGQGRDNSIDVAARTDVHLRANKRHNEGEWVAASSVGGAASSGRHGSGGGGRGGAAAGGAGTGGEAERRLWLPNAVSRGQRGTHDVRLHKEARCIMRAMGTTQGQ